MSYRTPRIDGLGVAPNAAGDANNPAASDQELQVHRFWGRYATAAVLPNTLGNPALNPAYSFMRPGDVAWSQADGTLYQLVDRGTLGGHDAIWLSLGSSFGPDYGQKIWEWQPALGVTQFDAAVPHRRDLGGGTLNAATAIIPSLVVGAGQPYDTRLRLTVTGLQGGGALPINDLPTLPDRFIARWILISSAQTVGVIFPMFYLSFAQDGGCLFQGFGSLRRTGSASADFTTVVNNLTGTAGTLASSGTLNATQAALGGIDQRIFVYKRQAGETPAYARGGLMDLGGASNTQVFQRNIVTSIAGVGANWDGVNLNRIGPGCFEAINGSTGSVDIALMEIYAFPTD